MNFDEQEHVPPLLDSSDSESYDETFHGCGIPFYSTSEDECEYDEFMERDEFDDSSEDDDFPIPIQALAFQMLVMNPLLFTMMNQSMMERERAEAKEKKKNEKKRKSMIQQLPQVSFAKQIPLKQDASCVICLCDFEEGDGLKKLPCDHHFHGKCIDAWIIEQPVCPLCKGSLGSSLREMKKIFKDKEKVEQKKQKDLEKKRLKAEKDKLKEEDKKRKLEENRKKREEQKKKKPKDLGSNHNSTTSSENKQEIVETSIEEPLQRNSKKRKTSQTSCTSTSTTSSASTSSASSCSSNAQPKYLKKRKISDDIILEEKNKMDERQLKKLESL